jgi:hypothetical protein
MAASKCYCLCRQAPYTGQPSDDDECFVGVEYCERCIDDRDVERRIGAFLWGGSNTIGASLHSLLTGPFSHFKRSAIVGGMVRDIALGSSFNSDIDIVIDATTGEVASVAVAVNARPNIFGGWTARRGGTDIDFWAFESTWAVSVQEYFRTLKAGTNQKACTIPYLGRYQTDEGRPGNLLRASGRDDRSSFRYIHSHVTMKQGRIDTNHGRSHCTPD